MPRHTFGRALSIALLCFGGTTAGVAHASPSNAAASHLWSQRFGDGDYQALYSVTTDASGNVFTGGFFGGTVDFGGGNLTSIGPNDGFVAKYSPSGAHLWSRRFGNSETTVSSVATDADGSVLVTGYFKGTIDLGGGPLTSAGLLDVFLFKLDASGAHLWSKRFGDANSQVAVSVATDADGWVILLGNFYGTINLGGPTRTSQGFNDVFVAKFDPDGAYEWSKRFGDSNDQFGSSVTTDADENVIIAGWFSGAIDFGGDNLVSAGFSDIFLAKLDQEGDHLWSRRFGDGNDQSAYSVATDASQNVIVTGGFYGTVDFGGGPLTSAGGLDLCLVKFNADGTHQWSRRFGDGAEQSGYAVATNANGDIFVTGAVDGTVDFGGGPLTPGGGLDAFVAKFSSAGAHEWSDRFGDGGGSQFGQSIATDASGHVIVGGVFDGAVNFGGSALTSAGFLDVFLAKFGESVSDVSDSPGTAGLTLSAYPNPVESSTMIRFTLPSPGPVMVEIYDVRGARVETLVNETSSSGTHIAAWNRRGTDSGPGVYFARVTHPAGARTYRMVVLR